MGPKRINDFRPKRINDFRPKRKMVRTSLELKRELISKYENGTRVSDLATYYGMARSTVSTILKNREAIKRAGKEIGGTSSPRGNNNTTPLPLLVPALMPPAFYSADFVMNDEEWHPPTEAEMKLIQARRERSNRISSLMSGYLLKGYKMLGVVCPKCDTILLQDRQGKNYCVACSELDSDTEKDNPVTNQAAADSMAKEMELSAPTAATTSENKEIGFLKAAAGDLPCHGSGLAGGDPARQDPLAALGEATQPFEVPETKFCIADVVHGQQREEQTDTTQTPPSELYIRLAPLSRTESETICPASDVRASPLGKHSAGTSQQMNGTSLPEPGSVLPLCISRLSDKIDWASRELKHTNSIEYSIQLCQLIKAAADAVSAVRTLRM